MPEPLPDIAVVLATIVGMVAQGRFGRGDLMSIRTMAEALRAAVEERERKDGHRD